MLFTVTSTVGFTPTPLEQSGLKLVCKVNIQYGKLKSENSQVSPETLTKLYAHEFGFCTYSKLHWTFEISEVTDMPSNMQYCNLNVQEIYEEFLERFVEKTRNLKVGDPLDSSVFMGAVNRC